MTAASSVLARFAGALACASLCFVSAAAAEPTAADPCVREVKPGDTYKVCFDPGNRLAVSAGALGLGATLLLRHKLLFADEPDLTWKLEHEILRTEIGYDEEGEVSLYRGRFLRHARDGHIVLPFGLPRKVFVPFDVGADVEVGVLRGPVREAMPFTVGVIRTAALIDLFRGAEFRRRVAIGVGSRWDLTVDRDPLAVAEHLVVPLSSGVLDIHFESANGLSQITLRAEAGGEWSSTEGWRRSLRAELGAERIAVAINDRPLSIYARAAYEGELTADIGLRLAAF